MPKQNTRLTRTIVLLAALPLAVLALGARCSAQTPHLAANGAPAEPSTLKARPSNLVELPEASPGETGGGLHEGVKVHGHWNIAVKNPNGTLVETRDFENSLASNGGLLLVGTLSGYIVPGDWMIVLGAASGNGPCINGYQFCGVVHNLNTLPASGYCGIYYCSGSTLTYGYNFGTNSTGPYSIVLSGQITSNETGSVGVVYTLLSGCGNPGGNPSPSALETTAPSACVANNVATAYSTVFTQTTLSSPVAVTSGQIIQVTVTITFS